MELKVKHLTKKYVAHGADVFALRDLSFALPAGETLAVVGPSGAGKSTLLNLLGGIDKPSAGEIWLGDERLDIHTEKQAAQFRSEKLGFVFQFHHLLKDFTSLENVMMPFHIQGVSVSEAKKRAILFLERVGLADKTERFPSELSGGEQQRVAIARALVHAPKLVLADEPTGNLDLKHGEAVFDLLVDLARHSQTTVVVVTHHPEFAKKLKHSLHLNSGQLTAFL